MMKDMITLYHGSRCEIESLKENQCIYATPVQKDAEEYALNLDDLGNYSPESWIYALEINEDDITIISDFMEFDTIGYYDYDNMPEVAYNPESGYYCIKHPTNIRLVKHSENYLTK